MPILWGNRRDRHDRHTHLSTAGTRVLEVPDGGRHHRSTHVSTTGTRVIEAPDSGRHHRRGRHHRSGRQATVVAVPETNVTTARATRSRGDHYYRGNPSTLHGLWIKVLGTLTGNRHRRRRGEREMRRAREQRHALRLTGRRVRDTGRFNKLQKLRQHRHHNRSHGHATDPVIIAQDGGHHHHGGRTPWGHFGSRALPSYHGAHHRFFGFLTGHRERVARGKAMAIAADQDRRRERRRRREEMMDQGRQYRERRRFWW